MSDDTGAAVALCRAARKRSALHRWRTRGHSLEWQCNRLRCSCVFICKGVLERHDHETARLARDLDRQLKERLMLDNVLNCSAGGWLMLAGSVVIYGVLALAAAVLIKHLFFADRSRAAS